MTVREATRKLLKDLEAIGWEVDRREWPTASYGDRWICFRSRSIISDGLVFPSAKYYVNCLHRLLLGWEPIV